MDAERRPFGRRGLLLGAAALGTAAALGAAPAAAVPAGFPTFTRLGAAMDKSTLSYAPARREIIFPSIRHVAGRVQNPLGAWYMYYAPHDDPGGICLAYADSLAGPWKEYSANPIISNTWLPHYPTVPHVSSPHAHWADGRMYLYFHGDNRTTRVATSTDGRSFTYGGTVLHTSMLPSNVTEASYARVFPHPTQSGVNIMLFMGNQAGTRKIFIGWSHSLTSGWQFKQQPLISPAAGEGGQVSGAHYWSQNGGGHVVFHGGDGAIRVARVGTGFDREEHLGVLYKDPVATRAAAPSFAEENGRMYMFYEAGARSSTNIAIARA
ncbi:hypothetical protein SAMN05216298_1868 [Glycomyces sambucus]|uniref:Glycosyl hydrolases family 43 n=1 Tax=Glycomyces sambucus TaxID=380244 RepID=A0A1G9FKV4_9ACTN|nr:hypothetical protein [Glycomyces sambucus]SDK89016.1 hypothetical protein SAMN05216298_1868 [Glycomyces sambucus]